MVSENLQESQYFRLALIGFGFYSSVALSHAFAAGDLMSQRCQLTYYAADRKKTDACDCSRCGVVLNAGKSDRRL